MAAILPRPQCVNVFIKAKGVDIWNSVGLHGWPKIVICGKPDFILFVTCKRRLFLHAQIGESWYSLVNNSHEYRFPTAQYSGRSV